jgi:hypothetical protein
MAPFVPKLIVGLARLTGLTYLAMIKLDLHVLQTLRNLRGLHVLEIDFGFSRGSFDEMPKLQDLEIIRHTSPELLSAVPNLTRLVYSDAQHAVVRFVPVNSSFRTVPTNWAFLLTVSR